MCCKIQICLLIVTTHRSCLADDQTGSGTLQLQRLETAFEGLLETVESLKTENQLFRQKFAKQQLKIKQLRSEVKKLSTECSSTNLLLHKLNNELHSNSRGKFQWFFFVIKMMQYKLYWTFAFIYSAYQTKLTLETIDGFMYTCTSYYFTFIQKLWKVIWYWLSIAVFAGRRQFENEEAVAFYGKLNVLVTNISQNEIIKFNNIVTDIGNAYHSSTGMFTAPVPGVYFFSVTVMVEKFLDTHVGIYVNNQMATNI